MVIVENLNPIVRRNLPRNAVFLPTFGQDKPTQLEPRAALKGESFQCHKHWY